ncbi:uncharacterized protein LOC135400065 [Ornithodoros turicata]|uniref:uncharacterized protein LOC135400065 n=1 Tax=Ornithodoros turicata TaxID=34597 RepID=UPI003138CBD5
MKVFAFSFMLFGLLRVVTSDCVAAAEAAGLCVTRLGKLQEYDDDFVGYLGTRDEKQALVCCGLDDLDGCIRRHLVGSCAYMVDPVSAYARVVFLKEVAHKVETPSCRAHLKNACNALRSRARQ